jgi:hypothetical protein
MRQQDLRINRGTSHRAVRVPQPFPHKAEIDIPINLAQQVMLRNLVFQSEVIKHRLHAGLLTIIGGVPPERRASIKVHSYPRKIGSKADFFNTITSVWSALKKTQNTAGPEVNPVPARMMTLTTMQLEPLSPTQALWLAASKQAAYQIIFRPN